MLNKESVYWIVLIIQTISMACLIRMGHEVTAIAKDDWSHKARIAHIIVLTLVAVLQLAGIFVIRRFTK